jgi:uncharacterized protein YjiS (DUF1127 family)
MNPNSLLIDRAHAHSIERHRRQMHNLCEGPAGIGPGSRSRGLVPQRELATAIRPTRPAVTICRKTVRASRPRWLRRIASLPGRLWSKLRHRHEQRQAARALYAFNDRMLKDIGISRSDIEYLQQGGETKHIFR